MGLLMAHRGHLRGLCTLRRDQASDIHGVHRWQSGGASISDANLGRFSRWRRRQYNWPACGGDGTSAMVEQVFQELPRSSAVGHWREARRRLGLDISDLSHGTTPGSLFAGLVDRGWDDWRDGEDRDRREAGVRAPPAGDRLADELLAFDRRHLVDRHVIGPLAELEDAIATGAGVGISVGVRNPFFDLEWDEVATDRHLGGDDNGHMMRLVGLVTLRGRRVGVADNWWDEPDRPWGGCTIEGVRHGGHCLLDEQVIRNAWAIWAITRRTR